MTRYEVMSLAAILDAQNVEESHQPSDSSSDTMSESIYEHTEWNCDMAQFVQKEIQFAGPAPGPVFPDISLLQFFQRFVAPNVVEHFVNATNSSSNRVNHLPRRRRLCAAAVESTPVTTGDFWLFVGVLLLIEIHGKPNIDDNWSQSWLLHIPASRPSWASTVSEVSWPVFISQVRKTWRKVTASGRFGACSKCVG